MRERHGEHGEQICACALAPSGDVREGGFVESGEEDGQLMQFIEIVEVLGEAFVICAVGEDVVFRLDPDVLDCVVVLVAQQETVELVSELFGQELGRRRGTF